VPGLGTALLKDATILAAVLASIVALGLVLLMLRRRLWQPARYKEVPPTHDAGARARHRSIIRPHHERGSLSSREEQEEEQEAFSPSDSGVSRSVDSGDQAEAPGPRSHDGSPPWLRIVRRPELLRTE